MKRVYKELRSEQKRRGVIFSSCLSSERVEQEGDIIHEVFADDENKGEKIKRLENISFFKRPITYNDYRIIYKNNGYHIIRRKGNRKVKTKIKLDKFGQITYNLHDFQAEQLSYYWKYTNQNEEFVEIWVDESSAIHNGFFKVNCSWEEELRGWLSFEEVGKVIKELKGRMIKRRNNL